STSARESSRIPLRLSARALMRAAIPPPPNTRVSTPRMTSATPTPSNILLFSIQQDLLRDIVDLTLLSGVGGIHRNPDHCEADQGGDVRCLLKTGWSVCEEDIPDTHRIDGKSERGKPRRHPF